MPTHPFTAAFKAAPRLIGMVHLRSLPGTPAGHESPDGIVEAAVLEARMYLATGVVRVEGFVYAHIADEGFIDACAGELLQYRRSIGAAHIAVLADIKKKHCSHAITADVSIEETARTAACEREPS